MLRDWPQPQLLPRQRRISNRTSTEPITRIKDLQIDGDEDDDVEDKEKEAIGEEAWWWWEGSNDGRVARMPQVPTRAGGTIAGRRHRPTQSNRRLEAVLRQSVAMIFLKSLRPDDDLMLSPETTEECQPIRRREQLRAAFYEL